MVEKAKIEMNIFHCTFVPLSSYGLANKKQQKCKYVQKEFIETKTPPDVIVNSIGVSRKVAERKGCLQEAETVY